MTEPIKLTLDEINAIGGQPYFLSRIAPSLPFTQMEKLLTGGIAVPIANYPGAEAPSEGNHVLRFDEKDICALIEEAGAAGAKLDNVDYFAKSALAGIYPAAQILLGSLVTGWDQPGGKGKPMRFYVSEARLNRQLDLIDPAVIEKNRKKNERNAEASRALTHDDIYRLQKAPSDVSGDSPRSGFKEFTYSALKKILGVSWQRRLEGYWEKSIGTGTEDVAAVNMEALSARMQREKDENRTSRQTGFGRY